MAARLLESDVMKACRVLFGPGPDIGREFLFYLQPDGARSAYRKKAKETHPDFFTAEGSQVQAEKTAQFRTILEAYETLGRFFKERDEGLWPSPSHAACGKRRPWGTRTAWKGSTFYYQGKIPFCVLELGRYLFYSGRISYGELIEALTWQRLQRPLIGIVALRWGWLVKKTVEQIAAAGDVPGRFGEKAVRLGLLTDFQVRVLLYYQHTLQERLGQYFIQKKIMTAAELERSVRTLNEHNASALLGKKAAGAIPQSN